LPIPVTSAEWSERFDDLVERRTREADSAAIAPLVTERDQAGDRFAAIGNAWSRAMFGGLFYLSPSAPEGLPITNLVFVQSRDGNTVAADPSVFGGGAADKHVIYEGLSRVAADAVLAGARTVQADDTVLSVWRPELVALRRAMSLPRHPVQIVATLNGVALDRALLFNVPELRVILLTAARGAEAMRDGVRARPWIQVVVVDDAAGLTGAFRTLRQLGMERISCIGGRLLAGQLLDAGLILDVYLTTGTATGGVAGTPVYDKPLHGREVVRKQGTGSESGVVFEHIAIAT
jgi:riboflavin biosynthesis pyrimidine reductase